MKGKEKMKSLRNHSEDVQKFLEGKGKIKVVAMRKGHSIAKPNPILVEVFGTDKIFCEGLPTGKMNGRDNLRQRSQKIGWTKKVRTNMGQTIQHREHVQMLRDGVVGVGQGVIEVPKTGTHG